ncbi:MAG: hypothetical protein R3F30_11300 [Planctomycetota bacterium]
MLLYLQDPVGPTSGTGGAGREAPDQGASVEPEAPGQAVRERSEVPTPEVPATGGRRVVDAVTGYPVPGAVFQAFLGQKSRKAEVRAVSDAEGRFPAEPFEALVSRSLEGWCIVARGYRPLAAEALPEGHEFRLAPSKEVRIVLKGLAEVLGAGYAPRGSITQADFAGRVGRVMSKAIQQAGIENRCEITGDECRVRPFFHEETVFYLRLVKGTYQQVAGMVFFEEDVFRYELEVKLPDLQDGTGALHLVLTGPRELDSDVSVYMAPPGGNRITFDRAFLPARISGGSGRYEGWIHGVANGDYDIGVGLSEDGLHHYGRVHIEGSTVYEATIQARLLRLDGCLDESGKRLGFRDAAIVVWDADDRIVSGARVDDDGNWTLLLPDTAYSWEGLGPRRSTGRRRLDRHPIPTWVVLLDTQTITLVLDDTDNRSRPFRITDLDQELSYRESVYFLAGKGILPLVPGRYRLKLEGHDPLEVEIPRDTGKELRLR